MSNMGISNTKTNIIDDYNLNTLSLMTHIMSVSHNSKNNTLKRFIFGKVLGGAFLITGVLMGVSSIAFVEFLEEYSILLSLVGFVLSLPIGTTILAISQAKYKMEKDGANYDSIELQNKLKKADNLLAGGLTLTFIGISFGLMGIPLTFGAGGLGLPFFILGFILSVPIGTPIWIYGASQRAGLKHVINSQIEFNENGVGLRLSW